MDDLLPAFQDSLFNATLADSAIDLAEIAIDTILVDGVFQEIPIVKILVGVGKFICTVRERNFLKQTFCFFSHLHDGSISSNEFSKYKRELEEDPTKAERELSRVMILLDKTIDTEKAEDLAAFFRAYIKNDMSWDDFCELSEALDRLFVIDIQMLNRIANLEHKMLFEEGGHSADRLVSVGLVVNPATRIQIGFGSTPPFGKCPVSLTEFGRTFLQHAGIDNLILD